MPELPFIFPPIETYQSSAFVLGIMRAHPKYADILHNGYIKLECKNTKQLSEMNLMFTDSLWDSFRIWGLAEMNLYNVSNFNKNTLLKFLCERIDQGNYLLLYDVDEFYLSYTDNYLLRHFSHDTYVYGYESGEFMVQAYQKEHLKLLRVNMQEIVESLLGKKGRKEISNKRSFCTFRPSINRDIRLDTKCILKEIKEFYEKQSEADKHNESLFNMDIYEVLIEAMCSIEAGTDADLRPFRCLWEHKKLMLERIKHLSFNEYSDCWVTLKALCEKTELIFRLMMKYNMVYQKMLIERAQRLLINVKQEELMWYTTYIKQLEGN